MQKIRNFRDVVKQSFFDEIENRVSLYVLRNFREMEFHSRKIDSVDEAHVQNQSLHRIVAYDTLGDTLAFDAVVVADIDIYHVSPKLDSEDTVQKWFRVSCEVDVADGFSNFKIINVDDEYDADVNRHRDGLDDNLIPVMSAADMERNAEEILRHVYPEALIKPMCVNVELFAERLGLQIVRKHLSRNGSIFGQMIFHPAIVDYYDLDTKAYKKYEADGGTIFADDEIFFLRNLGSWNNTIIHECVHWLKHRKHIELKRAAGADVSRISCQVTEMPKESKNRKRSDTEWMEWHANALAPRILMPRKMFVQKAEELIAWYRKNNGTDKLSDILAGVIVELSDFFGGSILSARIRMMDIGYSEVVGVLEYNDGQYLPSRSHKAGTITENQRFAVPMKEGLIQYAINPTFKAIIDNGDFVYIDGHYVINAPKYVQTNDYGLLEMTAYALANMDECCLSFERSTSPNPDYNVHQYTECILFQSAASKTVTSFDFKNNDNDKKVVANAAALRAELDEAKSADRLMAELPGSFGKSLVMIMKWRKVTVEKLGELALLEPRMIQRMRTDTNQVWKLGNIVALCIGLKLPPYMSYSLVEKAGLGFKHGEQQIALRHILTTRYNSTIHECNDLLAEAGYPPLSGIE